VLAVTELDGVPVDEGAGVFAVHAPTHNASIKATTEVFRISREYREQSPGGE
jgi:hypothetical protein